MESNCLRFNPESEKLVTPVLKALPCELINSAFRIPHSTLRIQSIPHSAFKAFYIPHSAFDRGQHENRSG